MFDVPATAKDKLYESYALMQYRIKALKNEVEEFQTGKRYLKLQEDYRRVVAGYIEEIKRLKQEIEAAHAETKRVLDIWSGQCADDWDSYRKSLEKKDAEIRKLEDKYWNYVRAMEDQIANLTKSYEAQLAEKDKVIDELKQELAHKEALLARDSTNTNLPTGQTPPGKEKHIPNGRRSTGKKRGGQPGHEKHGLEKPSESEIDEYEDHGIQDDEVCPTCGSGDFTYTGEHDDRYEYDVEIKVKKRCIRYWIVRCNQCGQLFVTAEAPKFKDETHYGANVDAVALSLMNTTNAAINKVPMLLSGMTGGEISPSEGYLAKLQKKSANNLLQFREDLRKLLITRELLYWDDTVIWANKKRICLRFYGDETIAFYVVHKKKDLPGILEDNILQNLRKEANVMHDHNTVNYNKKFAFFNLECNAHLGRDIQKSIDETGHEALTEIGDLISKTIKDRNDLVASGVKSFDEAYKNSFNSKLSDLLVQAKKDAKENTSKYSARDEKAIVARLIKYRENNFAWVEDFSLPVTNNLSERALRRVKTKMKVSGQFFSADTGDYYALIQTYAETCKRHGINEMEAFVRLCQGNPYTVKEIFSERS